MIMARDANKITRLMGLTIRQASKNFKSNRLLRILGRSNCILKNFVKHMNNCGRIDTWQARVIIHRGIHVAKNYKAVGSTDSQDNGGYFGASCNKWSNLK